MATVDQIFNAATGHMQGIATNGHFTWIAYDLGGGNTLIKTYTWDGTYIGQTTLPLGHGAEFDWRKVDNHLYVVNGGLESESTAALTKVFAVSLDANGIAQAISKTYDYTRLGENGLVCVDNSTDYMYVMGGPDVGPWQFVPHHFGYADSPAITITDPDVLLQGLGIVNGQIWLYVSDTTIPSGPNSRIDIFDLSTGALISKNALPFSGEAEGLAVNPGTGSIYIGATGPNRVMRLHL